MAALADDSGLSVAALNGAPGVYSARWAGPNRDFNIAMTAVEEAFLKLKVMTRELNLSVRLL